MLRELVDPRGRWVHDSTVQNEKPPGVGVLTTARVKALVSGSQSILRHFELVAAHLYG